ncbi:hypothetical protein [Psychrobacter pacificensis]
MKIFVGLISLFAVLLVALAEPLYQFGMIGLATAFTGFKFGVFYLLVLRH